MTAAVYGVGYEGRSADDLIDMLADEFVDEVADVRQTPISRKPHLSKHQLRTRLAEGAGIGYEHYQSLGNPKANRAGYKAGDPHARTIYHGVLHGQEGNLSYWRLLHACRHRRVAVLCACADHPFCHRSQILSRLAADGLDVRHI